MNRDSFADRQVFVDTSAFFAISNRDDTSHLNASTVLRKLVREQSRLITSNFVLAELHALLLTRINRAVALAVLQSFDTSKTTIVERVTVSDEIEARAILERYDDKDFSLTDATCFAIMGRLGIQRAFTLDRNFAQFGVETIPLD